MKILLISHEMTYTGAPNSLLNMARLLKKAGHRIKVVTLSDGMFSREFKRYGFGISVFDPRDKDAAKKIRDGFDLVIANTIFCGEAASVLQNDIPVILYIREAENLPEIMKNNGLNSSCITSAENIVCVSEYAESFIREKYFPRRLWVVHNFLIPKPFFRARPNKVRGGKVHFLIAATVEKRKGIEVAVKAFESLPESVRERAVLHIAGQIPAWSFNYGKKIIAAAQKNRSIIYHGEVTGRFEKHRLFSGSNVILVPSFDESCSLTALEGAMYGKALIVTENVGAKYIVKNCGFIIKTGSAEELAEAMNFMITENELTEMGRNAAKNFRNFSDPVKYLEDITKIFEEIRR